MNLSPFISDGRSGVKWILARFKAVLKWAVKKIKER